jgi:hypothetical protein
VKRKKNYKKKQQTFNTRTKVFISGACGLTNKRSSPENLFHVPVLKYTANCSFTHSVFQLQEKKRGKATRDDNSTCKTWKGEKKN